MTATPFEVLTMGRVGVDVYPEQVGVGLEEVETYRSYLGGSPTNVAVAAARLGRRSATITKVGADPFGRLVRRAFARYGVDDRFLSEAPGLQTPVTFCEMFPPDRFPHLLLPVGRSRSARSRLRTSTSTPSWRRASSGPRSPVCRSSRAGRRRWPRCGPVTGAGRRSSTWTTGRPSGRLCRRPGTMLARR